MKKFKKTITALLSALAVVMTIGTTAMAAEVSSEEIAADEQNSENKNALFSRDVMEDPEAYGLVLVEEAAEVEGDFTVVTKIYTEDVPETLAELPTGSKVFAQMKFLYDDKGDVILKTFLAGLFSWDCNDYYAAVDKDSATYYTDNSYKDKDAPYPDYYEHKVYAESNVPINFDKCGYLRYSITVIKSLTDTSTRLDNVIAVTCQGYQVDVTGYKDKGYYQ